MRSNAGREFGIAQRNFEKVYFCQNEQAKKQSDISPREPRSTNLKDRVPAIGLLRYLSLLVMLKASHHAQEFEVQI